MLQATIDTIIGLCCLSVAFTIFRLWYVKKDTLDHSWSLWLWVCCLVSVAVTHFVRAWDTDELVLLYASGAQASFAIAIAVFLPHVASFFASCPTPKQYQKTNNALARQIGILSERVT